MMKATWICLLFCMVVGAVMAQEVQAVRLKMAGSEPAKVETVAGETTATDAGVQEELTPEQKREKDVLEYIQKRPAFRDPLLAKQMYAVMRGLDDAIEKAHEEEMKQYQNDPQMQKDEQKKLDNQTPVRFEFKVEDRAQLTQDINQDAPQVVAKMVTGIKQPVMDDNTIDVLRNQMERMQKQFADEMGMTAKEYQELWRQQQKEEQQKIPTEQYDLTDVVLEGETDVRQ